MKTYVSLVRDHSVSMRPLAVAAANDYNNTIDGIKESLCDEGQMGVASVVECGCGHMASVRVVENLVPISNLASVRSYSTTGAGTPLWDSVGTAIESIENVYDKNDLGVAFLVMVITDGEENQSRLWTADRLRRKIAELQATDRWTFVFRVPRGAKRNLAVKLGIPEGNIMEWEQTESSMIASTQATVSATRSYFKARTSGKTSVGSFYADLSNVTKADISQMVDISATVTRFAVPGREHGTAIKAFFEKARGSYDLGKAYYQLTKTEKVQGGKNLIIYDKSLNRYYTGQQARSLLGFPAIGEIRVNPGNFGNYELYIQSTSVNRKLVGNTNVLHVS